MTGKRTIKRIILSVSLLLFWVWVLPCGAAQLISPVDLTTRAGVSVLKEDYFGYSVAVDGGIAVIGAPGDDSSESVCGKNGGEVYVFRRAGNGVWSLEKTLKSCEDDGEHFGYSVAVNSVKGTIVVGAPGEDRGSPRETNRGFLLLIKQAI